MKSKKQLETRLNSKIRRFLAKQNDSKRTAPVGYVAGMTGQEQKPVQAKK